MAGSRSSAASSPRLSLASAARIVIQTSRPPRRADHAAQLYFGRFVPATITKSQHGYYAVFYANSASIAWRLACELFLPHSRPSNSQLSRLEAGSMVLVPSAEGDKCFVYATFQKHIRPNQVEVRRINGSSSKDSSEVLTASDIRLPIATCSTLGDGPVLTTGTAVYALLGAWHDAAFDKAASSALGYFATIKLFRQIGADKSESRNGHSGWFCGGQLVVKHANSVELTRGMHVFISDSEHGSSNEVNFIRAELFAKINHEVLVKETHGGYTRRVILDNVYTRLEESLRVIASNGGFQRGIVTDFANGLFGVRLCGGGGRIRWVSAGEITTLECRSHDSEGACSTGTLVAMLPKDAEGTDNIADNEEAAAVSPVHSELRWLPAARSATNKLLQGTVLQRFQRVSQGDYGPIVCLTRKEGRFGMVHDESNTVVVVHPGSAAEDCGLRVGDSIKAVDGRPLEGLLTAYLEGKDSVLLEVKVAEMDLDNEWLASRKRLLLPALSHHGKGNLAINVGDECFVTGGTWSEALIVERRPDGSALVDYGGRARRWMSNGEWAWHDMCPCLLYTSPSPRDRQKSRMPSSA